SYASGPDIHESAATDLGNVARYATPPMVSVTDAVGRIGANVPGAGVPAVIAKFPVLGTLAGTSANLIEASRQPPFTSVFVGGLPPASAVGPPLGGPACPNVAQPGVSATVAIAVCALIAGAPKITRSRATSSLRVTTHFVCISQPARRNRGARTPPPAPLER